MHKTNGFVYAGKTFLEHIIYCILYVEIPISEVLVNQYLAKGIRQIRSFIMKYTFLYYDL